MARHAAWVFGRRAGLRLASRRERARSGRLGLILPMLDGDGPVLHVAVFESQALPQHWDRLDAFEGPGYRRVTLEVATAEGALPASIYVLAQPTNAS